MDGPTVALVLGLGGFVFNLLGWAFFAGVIWTRVGNVISRQDRHENLPIPRAHPASGQSAERTRNTYERRETP